MRPARPWCDSALRSRPRGPGTTYHSPAPRRGEAQAPAPGVAAFGPAAGRPPTPRSAERGWTSPGCRRRSRSRRAPGRLRPGPRFRPPCPRLGLDALAAGWRRVTTSLPSPRSSRFLRSGKALGWEMLGGVGRRPPTLIFAARGAATATVALSVLPWPSHAPPHSRASPRTWTLSRGPDPERGGRPWPPPKDRPPGSATLSQQEDRSDTTPWAPPLLTHPRHGPELSDTVAHLLAGLLPSHLGPGPQPCPPGPGEEGERPRRAHRPLLCLTRDFLNRLICRLYLYTNAYLIGPP